MPRYHAAIAEGLQIFPRLQLPTTMQLLLERSRALRCIFGLLPDSHDVSTLAEPSDPFQAKLRQALVNTEASAEIAMWHDGRERLMQQDPGIPWIWYAYKDMPAR